MVEQMKRGGISPTSKERKNDGPFRTCVYIGAMLARDRFKKKSLIKMTKNRTQQKTYIDENSVGN